MAPQSAGTAPFAALELKGGGHALLPDVHAPFDRGLTFQAWVRLTDLAASSPIFAFGERPDLRALSIVVAAGSGDLVVEIVDRAGAARTLVAPAALVAGKWTHVSIVLGERTVARVVVDGQERARGKLARGAWISNSGLARARPADARITRALQLDGAGFARLAGLERGFGDGYTLETWVCPATFTGAPLLDLCDWRGRDLDSAGAAHDRIALQVSGAGDLQFIASRGLADPGKPGSLRVLTAKDVLQLDRWTHVAVTVAPTGLAVLHVDGRPVGERVLFTPEEIAADTSVIRRVALLGRRAGATGGRFTGALAELRIWARVLAGDELRDRRHLRLAGTALDE